MAVTVSLYNHTVKKIVNKEFTYTTMKVMLLNNTASFVAADTTLNQVAASGHTKEVSGNGWTVGGITLANFAGSIVTTNDAKLDADDAIATATGGDIGPAYAAVLYDDTDAGDAPVLYIDFGVAQTAGQDTDFRVVWHANGIITFTY